MDLPDPAAIAQDLTFAIDSWNASTPRGQQSIEGRVGVSDIGVCREYVRFLTVGEEPTDEPAEYKAFIGTALDEYIVRAMKRLYPDSIEINVTTIVTLPSGASYEGHPDIVTANGVIDVKTVDGLTQVKRQGPTLAQRFQRQLYACGLVQEGRLPKECWVANAWFDRSGRDSIPHVEVEAFDESWVYHADEWLSDVFYAVKTGEEAPKDKPVEWCAVACEFYSACRAKDVLTDSEGGGLIEDPELIDMVEAYKEARDMKKAAEKQLDDARRALASTSGRTGSDMVKWIFVNESDVPGYTRSGYSKLDIRPLPKARSRR